MVIPKKNMVSFRLEDEYIKKVQTVCDQFDVERSEVLRLFIKSCCDVFEKLNKKKSK